MTGSLNSDYCADRLFRIIFTAFTRCLPWKFDVNIFLGWWLSQFVFKRILPLFVLYLTAKNLSNCSSKYCNIVRYSSAILSTWIGCYLNYEWKFRNRSKLLGLKEFGNFYDSGVDGFWNVPRRKLQLLRMFRHYMSEFKFLLLGIAKYLISLLTVHW